MTPLAGAALIMLAVTIAAALIAALLVWDSSLPRAIRRRNRQNTKD